MIWGRSSLVKDPAGGQSGAGIMFTGAVYADSSDNVTLIGPGLALTIHTNLTPGSPPPPLVSVVDTVGTRVLNITVTGVGGLTLHWYVEILNLSSPTAGGLP
jgi:hypothetical protein